MLAPLPAMVIVTAGARQAPRMITLVVAIAALIARVGGLQPGGTDPEGTRMYTSRVESYGESLARKLQNACANGGYCPSGYCCQNTYCCQGNGCSCNQSGGPGLTGWQIGLIVAAAISVAIVITRIWLRNKKQPGRVYAPQPAATPGPYGVAPPTAQVNPVLTVRRM